MNNRKFYIVVGAGECWVCRNWKQVQGTIRCLGPNFEFVRTAPLRYIGQWESVIKHTIIRRTSRMFRTINKGTCNFAGLSISLDWL